MTQLFPTFTGKSGRALFSLVFLGAVGSPSLMAAENTPSGDSAKKEEAMTVVGTAQADQTVTEGYQPISSSTATLTSMPLLDIPQVVNTVSDKVLEDQHATSLDEALYNVANVVQTNTLGAPRTPLPVVALALTAMVQS